jgi:hypothetical protein
MQVMWMVLVTLGLALGGILGLAVISQVTARARRLVTACCPSFAGPWPEWRSGAPLGAGTGASKAGPRCLP